MTRVTLRNIEMAVETLMTIAKIAKAMTSECEGETPPPTHRWTSGAAVSASATLNETLTRTVSRTDLTTVFRTHSRSPRESASPYAGQRGARTRLSSKGTKRKSRSGTVYAVTAVGPRIRARTMASV